MSIIDREQFQQNFQYFDKEVVLEIINIFIDEYPSRMEIIKKNIDEKDFDQLRFNAHSLKGVIANFVAPEAHELARSLEMKGTNKDDEDVDSLYNALREKADMMIEELKELRADFK